MQKLEIELPWPPSINHYWRHTPNGHYISDEGKRYRDVVCLFTRSLRNWNSSNDKLSMVIYAHPPDKRRRDLDNILKSLLDALQHAEVYADDYQIDRLSIRRVYSFDGIVKISLEKICL